MKVFLSWSGQKSNLVAHALRHWLPTVLQAARPYYSPDDIGKGMRWSAEVANELQQAEVGILCVTRENLVAPWLMFEAGALAKSLDRSRVVPLLLGVEPADLSGPLAQFQASRFDMADVRRVIAVVNTQLGESGLEESVLDRVFEKWWPDLELKVEKIMSSQGVQPDKVLRSDRALLEEVLELLRTKAFQPPPKTTVVATSAVGSLPVERLDITVRTAQNLHAEGIHTVDDLLEWSETKLLKTPNIGRRALSEISSALAQVGSHLKAPEGGASGA